MIGCEAVVKAVIEQPYRVYQDKRHLHRRVFYKPFVLPRPFHTQYLRVVVQYKERRFGSKRGHVMTAFACTQVREGDILLWEE